MRKMTSREIREMWLKYFSENGHKIVPSASLIPHDDDTLLWINAGVAPLKSYCQRAQARWCENQDGPAFF